MLLHAAETERNALMEVQHLRVQAADEKAHLAQCLAGIENYVRADIRNGSNRLVNEQFEVDLTLSILLCFLDVVKVIITYVAFSGVELYSKRIWCSFGGKYNCSYRVKQSLSCCSSTSTMLTDTFRRDGENDTFATRKVTFNLL